MFRPVSTRSIASFPPQAWVIRTASFRRCPFLLSLKQDRLKPCQSLAKFGQYFELILYPVETHDKRLHRRRHGPLNARPQSTHDNGNSRHDCQPIPGLRQAQTALCLSLCRHVSASLSCPFPKQSAQPAQGRIVGYDQQPVFPRPAWKSRILETSQMQDDLSCC